MVWTDVVQFFVVVAAAITAGVYLLGNTVGGLSEIVNKAAVFGKLQVFDFRLDQVLELTIWTGIFGSTFNTLASHGTDQMNTQRILSCRTASDARKAVLWSSLSQAFVLLLLCLGLALFCYYRQNTQSLQEYTLEVRTSNVFPIFIATVLPSGLKGLLVVGLLAAAISSMSSALAALSQTTARSLYMESGSRKGETGKPQVTDWSNLHLRLGNYPGIGSMVFHVDHIDRHCHKCGFKNNQASRMAPCWEHCSWRFYLTTGMVEVWSFQFLLPY